MSMEAVYKTAQDRSIFIKFTCLEAMMQSLRKNAEPRKFVYANGAAVEVKMCIAGTRYVRIFDLPPEISDDLVSSVLGQYGRVERIVREKFATDSGLGHLHNGVRGMYIGIKNDIPPAVVIGNWKARIFYDGLVDTCFFCRAVGHRKDACPQRQTRKNERKNKDKETGISSYASVVSGAAKHPCEQEGTETLEDDIIEVLEDDDQQSDAIEEEQPQPVNCKANDDMEKEKRRKESMEQLEEMAKAIKEVLTTPTASQRRAHFAASGSSSGSGSRPTKKCARRTFY